MPLVNIVDEVFIVASPERVRAIVCDAGRWAGWLPGVDFTQYDDRGPLGVRWRLTGELTGTAEVWLEEHGDGVVVHSYVRADPTDADRYGRRRSGRRVASRCAFALKRAMFDVKDLLEGARQPGSARVPLGERVVSASDRERGDRQPRTRRATGTGSKGAAPDGRPDHGQHPDRL